MKTIPCQLPSGVGSAVQALLIAEERTDGNGHEWLLVSPKPLGRRYGMEPANPDTLMINASLVSYPFQRITVVVEGSGDGANAIYAYTIRFESTAPQI